MLFTWFYINIYLKDWHVPLPQEKNTYYVDSMTFYESSFIFIIQSYVLSRIYFVCVVYVVQLIENNNNKNGDDAATDDDVVMRDGAMMAAIQWSQQQ